LGDVEFTSDQYTRYSRHLILPEIGIDGQKALCQAKVLVIGAGGLGSPACLYLAAAGVGIIGIVDFDRVDLTNLQRQLLHTNQSIGEMKVDSAERSLLAINPEVKIQKHPERLTSSNALEIIGGYDIVIDGTDNFPTRYLLNDACVFLKKPMIYGSIYRFEGQTAVFDARRGPCYRCLYPEPPDPSEVPSCAEGGVLGVLPGLIGSIQATECIKLIVGQGEPLIGRLLIYNALDMKFREVKFRRSAQCPVCGDAPTIRELTDYEEFCGVYEDEEPAHGIPQIEAGELKEKMDRGEDFLLLDVRQPGEVAFARIEGSVNFPLSELRSRLDELNPHRARPIVVVCRDGKRSQKACEILHERGFADLSNVHGGLLAWRHSIDKSIPNY
jgi:molybdopterin/thiamine biosynthesis adenylyltransferase/rhodanese-related sulfurtransferase